MLGPSFLWMPTAHLRTGDPELTLPSSVQSPAVIWDPHTDRLILSFIFLFNQATTAFTRMSLKSKIYTLNWTTRNRSSPQLCPLKGPKSNVGSNEWAYTQKLVSNNHRNQGFLKIQLTPEEQRKFKMEPGMFSNARKLGGTQKTMETIPKRMGGNLKGFPHQIWDTLSISMSTVVLGYDLVNKIIIHEPLDPWIRKEGGRKAFS